MVKPAREKETEPKSEDGVFVAFGAVAAALQPLTRRDRQRVLLAAAQYLEVDVDNDYERYPAPGEDQAKGSNP